MTRRTSIEAYNFIKDNGLLSKRRWQVYDILYQHGPLTGNQLIKIARREYPMLNTGAFNTRLSELRDRQVVSEIKEVLCPISGHRVILWDVNDRLPFTPKRVAKTKCKHCDGKGYTQHDSI